MTTFKHPRGRTFRYDFQYTPPGATKPVRHTGSTGQLTKADADLVERDIMTHVRQEAYGIAPFDRMQTPSFTAWAAQHLAYVTKRGRVTRLDEFEKTLKLCLQFWGRRPAKASNVDRVPKQWRKAVQAAADRAASAPYHDLRLADPIAEPDWIEQFEDWLTSRGLSGPRKNHYRSAMSGLYRTALLPAFRKKTHVSANPFQHLERDHVPSRLGTLTAEQLEALITAAPLHVRIALAIATYAPEMRLGSILKLRWTLNLNPSLTQITTGHKTERHTGLPQIIPVSVALHEILKWAHAQAQAAQLKAPTSKADKYVITYHGQPIKRLGTALRSAVTKANKGLPKDLQMTYGVRLTWGVTFHSVRHTMATLLAQWGEPEAIRQLVMGHRSLATTQKYTHLASATKTGPLERIGAKMQLRDAVQGNSRRHTTWQPKSVVTLRPK